MLFSITYDYKIATQNVNHSHPPFLPLSPPLSIPPQIARSLSLFQLALNRPSLSVAPLTAEYE